jgi:glycosyltransferase involved in cell wall biosynthesis
MQEIKILQVCNTDFYLMKFLTPLVVALHDKGYTVECLTEGTSVSQHLVDRGIRVHNFHFPPKASPWQFLEAIQRMKNVLGRADFHIVNGHNRNSSIVTRIASAMAGIPINLYTAHGFYYHDNQSAMSNKLAEVFEGILAKITTYTLSQSDEDTIRMTGRGWISPDRIRTIGNGIDAERFSPVTETRTAEGTGKLRVCASGRLVSGKGFEDILRAISIARNRENIEFVFIGGNIVQDISPSLDEFADLVLSLGLEGQVRITGMVDNVEEYLGGSDLFIHPSYVEGMPRSLLEAMSVGLPCIATRIRGAREIIENGGNGFIYEPHDFHALADLIDALFADRVLRERVGAAARGTILKRYQEKDYVQRQVQAMEDVLREKGFL